MDSRATAVRLILDGQAGLSLDRPTTWKRHGSGWRFSSPLKTDLSGRIILCMSLGSLERLHRPTVLLRDDGPPPNNLVRLDVRSAPHPNRLTDGRTLRGTHVHHWRSGIGDKHAEPPGPNWPPLGVDEHLRKGDGGDLEQIFDWFCTTHHVVLGTHYEWKPPPLGEGVGWLTTPEGDEIP